jgi:hypothetical protein
LRQRGCNGEAEQSDESKSAEREGIEQRQGYGLHGVSTTGAWQIIADIESTSILRQKVATAKAA